MRAAARPQTSAVCDPRSRAESGIPVGRSGNAAPSGGAAPAGGKGKGGGRQAMSLTELVIRSAAQSFARSASTQIAREGGKILRNSLGGIIGGAIGDAISGGGGGGGRRTRAMGSGVPRAGSSDFAGEMSDLLGGAERRR